jgi:hypothetical protein
MMVRLGAAIGVGMIFVCSSVGAALGLSNFFHRVPCTKLGRMAANEPGRLSAHLCQPRPDLSHVPFYSLPKRSEGVALQ